MVKIVEKKKKLVKRTLNANGLFEDYTGPKKGSRGKSTLSKKLNIRVIQKEITVEEAMSIRDLKDKISEKDWDKLENGDVYLEDYLEDNKKLKKELVPDEAPAPYLNWTVAKMKKWLKEQNIDHDPKLIKAQLLDLVEKAHESAGSEVEFDGESDEF